MDIVLPGSQYWEGYELWLCVKDKLRPIDAVEKEN